MIDTLTGEQIDLHTNEIVLRDEGVTCAATVDCPPTAAQPFASIIIGLDNSRQMKSTYYRDTLFTGAVSIASRLLDRFLLDSSAIAILPANAPAADVSFSNDTRHLNSVLANLRADTAASSPAKFLLDPQRGLLARLAAAPGRRHAILITHHYTTDLSAAETAAVIDTCLRYGIVLHVFALSGWELTAYPNLQKAALATTGEAYFQINRNASTQMVIEQFTRAFRKVPLCSVTWHVDSSLRQPFHDVAINIPALGLTRHQGYGYPIATAHHLDASPRYVIFSDAAGAEVAEREVTISTALDSVRVLDLRCTNPYVRITEVVGQAVPFVLHAGQQCTIRMQGVTAGDRVGTGDLIITTDRLPGSVSLITGCRTCSAIGLAPHVDAPAAGDLLVAGDTAVIRWSGVDESAALAIEWSGDHGAHWNMIGDAASGLEHPWRVPDLADHTPAIVRVTAGRSVAPIISFPLKHRVRDACLSPDGRHVVVGGAFEAVVFNAATGREEARLNTTPDTVRAAQWSPTGSMIALARGNHVAFFTPALALIADTVVATTIGPDKVRWNADGTMLAYNGPRPGVLDAPDSVKHDMRVDLPYDARILDFAWHPDGKTLAMSFDLNQRFFTSVLRPGEAFVRHTVYPGYALWWSPDGTRAASELWTGAVITEAVTGGVVGVIGHDTYLNRRSFAWHPDGARAAIGDDSGWMYAVDMSNGRHIFQYRPPEAGFDPIRSLAWSPDGALLAVSWLDGTIRVFDAIDGGLVGAEWIYPQGADEITWSADGSRLLVRPFHAPDAPTSAQDNVARIYPVIRMRMVESTHSSPEWFIIRPSLELAPIAFGIAHPGAVRDTLVTSAIRNRRTYAIRIDSTWIDGGSSGEYELRTELRGVDLAPGDSADVGIRFACAGAGIHRAQLHLRGRGLDTVLQLSAAALPEGNGILLEVYPNPVRDGSAVAYVAWEGGDVRVDVVDLRGTTVRSVSAAAAGVSVHSVPITLEGLASGTYFIHVQAGSASAMKRLVVYRP